MMINPNAAVGMNSDNFGF